MKIMMNEELIKEKVRIENQIVELRKEIINYARNNKNFPVVELTSDNGEYSYLWIAYEELIFKHHHINVILSGG